MGQNSLSHQFLVRLFLLIAICISIGNLCSWIMGKPLHDIWMRHALLGAVLGGLGSLIFTWQVCKTIWVVGQVLKKAQPEIPQSLQMLLSEVRLSSHIVLIQTEQPLAFCFGFLRPAICLSTGLLDLLSPAEIKAVLLHEESHRQHYDPLRILLVKVGSVLFCFLPVIREWSAIYQIRLELRADEQAIAAGGKVALAGALYRLLANTPQPMPGVAIAGLNASHIRIAALLGDREPFPTVSSRSLLVSSVVLWLVCLLFMI